MLPDEEAWDVLEEIPNDSAAALVLLEHHWAVPLRDAVVRAGGFRISDGFISPLDLVEVGLHSAEEAQELHEVETAHPSRLRQPTLEASDVCISQNCAPHISSRSAPTLERRAGWSLAHRRRDQPSASEARLGGDPAGLDRLAQLLVVAVVLFGVGL